MENKLKVALLVDDTRLKEQLDQLKAKIFKGFPAGTTIHVGNGYHIADGTPCGKIQPE
jgi:hypothetical protein